MVYQYTNMLLSTVTSHNLFQLHFPLAIYGHCRNQFRTAPPTPHNHSHRGMLPPPSHPLPPPPQSPQQPPYHAKPSTEEPESEASLTLKAAAKALSSEQRSMEAAESSLATKMRRVGTIEGGGFGKLLVAAGSWAGVGGWAAG